MKNEQCLRVLLNNVPFVRERPHSGAECIIASPLTSSFKSLSTSLHGVGLRWQRQACGGIGVTWLDGPKTLQSEILSQDELASSIAAEYAFSASLLLQGSEHTVALCVYPSVGVTFDVACLLPHEVLEFHRAAVQVVILNHIRRYKFGQYLWISYDSSGEGIQTLPLIASGSWAHDLGALKADFLIAQTSVCQKILSMEDGQWEIQSTYVPYYSVMLPVLDRS